ncbi:hypothetical protein ES708_19361 [subsurface metagenome]
MSLVSTKKLILLPTAVAKTELANINGRLMRKPRKKTAKKGGVWTRIIGWPVK